MVRVRSMVQSAGVSAAGLLVAWGGGEGQEMPGDGTLSIPRMCAKYTAGLCLVAASNAVLTSIMVSGHLEVPVRQIVQTASL